MDRAIIQLTTDVSQLPLQKIGQGFCGTVWADVDQNIQGGGRLAIKREDGGPGRSILHEHQIHEQLLRTLQTKRHISDIARFRVHVPFCEGLLTKDSPSWPRVLPRLPRGFEACNALVSERIPPMTDRVCALLLSTYHPEPSSATALQRDYCLVRPYLGRRRYRPQAATRPRPSRLRVFSLRNFPLHIDQIEELGLPAEDYAIALADTLAFLHWTAKVDANDVEFVLAPARPPKTTKASPGIGSVAFESEVFGSHAMWVLDFDCCRELPMDEAGIKQAASAFLRNDPSLLPQARTH